MGGAADRAPRRTGRLLILTSPLDREWNDLAIHPLFVRFIGEAARYLTSAATAPSAMVGSVLPLGVNAQRTARKCLIRADDARWASAIPSGQTRLLADQVGFYEVRGGGRSDWIAVNPDRRESDLTRLSPDAITQWTRMQKPAETTTQVAQQRVGDELLARPLISKPSGRGCC